MYILLYYDVGSLCSPPHWPAPTVPHHWSCTWLHAPLTSGEPPSHLWRPSRWRQVNAVNPGRVGLGGWWRSLIDNLPLLGKFLAIYLSVNHSLLSRGF